MGQKLHKAPPFIDGWIKTRLGARIFNKTANRRGLSAAAQAAAVPESMNATAAAIPENVTAAAIPESVNATVQAEEGTSLFASIQNIVGGIWKAIVGEEGGEPYIDGRPVSQLGLQGLQLPTTSAHYAKLAVPLPVSTRGDEPFPTWTWEDRYPEWAAKYAAEAAEGAKRLFGEAALNVTAEGAPDCFPYGSCEAPGAKIARAAGIFPAMYGTYSNVTVPP